MKLFGFMLAFLLGGAQAFAAVGMPSDSDVRYLLNTGQQGALNKARLGNQVVDKTVRVMKAVYSTTFYTSTTVGLYTLRDVDGKDARLPKNAIIRQVYVDTLVDVQGMSNAMTISVGASAVHRDMLNQWNADWFRSTQPRVSMNPPTVGPDQQLVASTYKLAAASTVDVHIFGAGIKQGKFNLWIEYLVSDPAVNPRSHTKSSDP